MINILYNNSNNTCILHFFCLFFFHQVTFIGLSGCDSSISGGHRSVRVCCDQRGRRRLQIHQPHRPRSVQGVTALTWCESSFICSYWKPSPHSSSFHSGWTHWNSCDKTVPSGHRLHCIWGARTFHPLEQRRQPASQGWTGLQLPARRSVSSTSSSYKFIKIKVNVAKKYVNYKLQSYLKQKLNYKLFVLLWTLS